MQFVLPHTPGHLVRRYKRFLADVTLADGTLVTAHCANTGPMTTCAEPGSRVHVSDSGSLTRKLRFTWELISVGHTWVGINTAVANRVVAHYVAAGAFPELKGYTSLRREVAYGGDGRSRIDLLLEAPGQTPCYVEIKSATLRVGDHAAFPDAVTVRGQKHLRELTALARAGVRAVMFYFIGRSDCARLRPADEIDPVYGALLREAVRAGVEVLAYRMHFTPRGVHVLAPAPVDLAPETRLAAPGVIA